MKPNRTTNRQALLIFTALGLLLGIVTSPAAGPIVVNSTFDGQFAGDTNPGDGLCDYDAGTPGEQCTLRAAIQEANALSGADTITFDPAVFATPTTIVVSWESLEPANGTTLTIDGGANKVTIASMFGGHRQFALGTGFAPGANLTLNNISINNGGGIVVGRFCTLTVNNALFAGNSGAPGSGIFNSGTLTVNNSTFSENNGVVVEPGFNGGAIHNGGIATVKNSMFVLNRGHLGGAIFNHPDGTISLGNSYVGLNHAAEGDATFGTITSLGHIAFRVPPDMIGDLTGNFRLIDHLYQYYPLADNGGPTKTHALRGTSGLIDKGTSSFGPAFDQRGFPRPYDDPTIPNATDGTDIGPFEAYDHFASFVVNKTTDTDDGVCDSDCSLREAINLAINDPGAETITFDPAVFTPSGSHTIQLTTALPVLSTVITISGPGANVLAVRGDGSIGSYRIFTIVAGATINISGLTVTNGFIATHDGGAGIFNSGTLALTGVTVSGNRTKDGGLPGGTGGKGRPGGGIFNEGTLTISNSTISGNQTGAGGNGTFNGESGDAGGPGGGIFNEGTLTINNSTISGNQAGAGGNAFGCSGCVPAGGGDGGSGGGIINATGSTLTVSNSTVTGNQAGAGGSGTSGNGAGGSGGGISNTGGTVNARNSIIAGNAGSTAPDFHGTLTSQGYNLIGSTVSMTIVGDTTGNILNQNALLGSLQNNGGPTPTLHPLPGSPVIDAGDPVFSGTGITDQRGWPRVSFGRVDIGAVEYAPFAGNSALFDGVNDFLILSNAGLTLPTNEITVELWERVETVRDQFSFILFPDVTTNRLSFSPVRLGLGTYWDFGDLFNGGRVSYGTPSGTINQWTHWTLVSTRASNAMRIYRNGALDTSSATNRALVRYAAALVLGARLDANGPEYFKGEIDEFRIWSVARTPSEIQTDMNNGLCPPQANLWLYWKFNEPSGATVLDHSGNGRDGLLFNGATRTVSFAPLLPPGAASVVRLSPTQVRVTWTPGLGCLQSAPEATGPWTDLPGTTNGQIIVTTPARQFFRVVQ